MAGGDSYGDIVGEGFGEAAKIVGIEGDGFKAIVDGSTLPEEVADGVNTELVGAELVERRGDFKDDFIDLWRKPFGEVGVDSE